MDTQVIQYRQRIEQTRTAMTAKLDLLEQRVSQKVAETVEQTVIAPVRGLLWTTTRSTTLLQQCPWLIIAGGALFGYWLSGANARPIRPVQSPPQWAIGASQCDATVEPAMPQVYDSPRQPSTRAAAPPESAHSPGSSGA
jgi:hypothetical protein